MDDRFKFRFWNKGNKKIETYSNDDLGFLLSNPKAQLRYVVMQCTGLKDKNGKLIYEGDIVVFYFDNDEMVGVISWSAEYQVGFYVNTTDYFKDKYVTDYELLYGENYEVIGNIYENEDLLKCENQ